MNMVNPYLFATVVVLWTRVTLATELQWDYKHLSGSPKEFPQHEISAPIENAIYSDSYQYQMFLDQPYETTVVSDSTKSFTISIVSALPFERFDVALTDPNGKGINMWPHGRDLLPCNSRGQEVYPCKMVTKVADGSESTPGVLWTFGSPLVGSYTLKIAVSSQDILRPLRAKKQARNQTRGLGDAMLAIGIDSNIKLFTHSIGCHSVTGNNIGVAARMFDNVIYPFDAVVVKNRSKPIALRDVVSKAIMRVTFPSGKVVTTPLHDDGKHGDEFDNDGEYSAIVTATEPGRYEIEALIDGTLPSHDKFKRTSSHTLLVSSSTASFTGVAVARPDTSTQRLMIDLMLDIAPKVTDLADTVRPYAEVWCQKNGQPITYATNLANFQSSGSEYFVSIEVDMHWLAKCRCTDSSIELRNVYLAAVDTTSIYDTAEEMKVTLVSSQSNANRSTMQADPHAEELLVRTVRHIIDSDYDGTITLAMKQGIPKTPVGQLKNPNAPVDCTIVLVHGYCAGQNPFELQSEDWNDACYYSAVREGDPIATENDVFAKNVLRFIGSKNIGAYSMVGQSQGGMVIMHILNMYWTGMDAADLDEGRVIQSVATPYLGNSAFSSLGSIVDIVAGDCSVPNSLSREGATSWISGVSQDTIDKANIYWTQYAPGGLFGEGWCNQLMNIFLQKPNDGATEVVFAMPSTGGTEYPEKIGWCHADKMEWPWSVKDSERNGEMNAAAARPKKTL